MADRASSMRVPTPVNHGWSIETLLDLVNEKYAAVEQRFADLALLVNSNDRRYTERVEAERRAIDAALAAQKEAVKSALDAADRAVAKAETASEKRFEGVNEFRAQLGDQQRNLMPRAEAEIRFSALAAQLDELRRDLSKQRDTQSGAKEGWGSAATVIGLVLTVVLLIGGLITLLTRFARP